VAQVPGNVAAWPAEAVAQLKCARVGRPRRQAVLTDSTMHALSMVEWRDKLLAYPQCCTEVRLPRADGASVLAIAIRVHASQRGSR
jgi:hypothetical protein